MSRNVEIKARVSDLATLTRRVEAIANEGPMFIDQEDTFFPIATGRLKLRKFSDSSGELIFYERPDGREPRECRYLRLETSTPDQLAGILARALGIRGVVRKRRTLYLAGQTRIHLDDVEGLGHYVELEVVLTSEQSSHEGEVATRELMRNLGIDEKDLVDQAYIDLKDR
jgi:predicted adenylyl cyclase CyaB